jgi:glutamyl-Q tRNA(Asp) synthetase
MIVTRFAPSPTGALHLGHAYAALFAAAVGARFLLRIEDIDKARASEEYAAAIVEDLRWLELDFAEPVLRQSQRFAAYREALDDLTARGLLYPCFCTRKEIAEEIYRSAEAPHGPDGPLYPGSCRRLSAAERERRIAAGAPYALRLDVEKAARMIGELFFEEQGAGMSGEHGRIAVDPGLFGDVVLARKEVSASYHLAVVLDDAHQGVTLVTRGNDLFASAHIQRVLQALLGLPAPAYRHHKLILDEQGRKFSKRDHAATLAAMREAGVTAEEIRKTLGFV